MSAELDKHRFSLLFWFFSCMVQVTGAALRPQGRTTRTHLVNHSPAPVAYWGNRQRACIRQAAPLCQGVWGLLTGRSNYDAFFIQSTEFINCFTHVGATKQRSQRLRVQQWACRMGRFQTRRFHEITFLQNEQLPVNTPASGEESPYGGAQWKAPTGWR